jgi:hypothetical protein
MLRALIVAGISAAAAIAAQTVEGHVVNAISGDDLPGVNVIVAQMAAQPAAGPYRAITDAKGRFRIEGVEGGSYIANYRAPGFWSPYDPGDITQPKYLVGDAEEPLHLEAKLEPVPKLSGRVLDPQGKPVANAALWMIEQRRPCRTPSCFLVARQIKTGEKGEFSTADFDRPGTWLIAAVAPETLEPPKSEDGQALVWAETFYPGVTDPQVAQTIAVEGPELPQVEIRLAARPGRRIRGQVVDAHGDPARLVDIEATNGFGLRERELTDHDGNFEFDVTEGSWRVTASHGDAEAMAWAAESIDIGERDAVDLRLRLAEPFQIHGKIVLDAPQGVAIPDTDLPNVIANYDPGDIGRDGMPPSFPIGHPDKTGNFSIQAYPGKYSFVILEDPPPGFYLESIRLGDAEALVAGGVSIEPDAQPLTATYKYGGGTVRGTVEGCGEGRAVLVPREPGLLAPQFIRQAKCGPNGDFEFTSVRPGDYYCVGMAGSGVPSGWATVDQDSVLAKQGVGITVREGETVSAEARVIRF